MKDKQEKLFIEQMKKHPKAYLMAGDSAVMEGFEYYKTDEYKSKPDAAGNRLKLMYKEFGVVGIGKLLSNVVTLVPSILKNINANYKDMEAYVGAINNGEDIPSTPLSIMDSYPNDQLWQDLKDYAWNQYGLIVGFTELPQEYIFEGKGVPFKYALVFIEAMDKEEIEKAPEVEAGIEVMHVYNSLGIATNAIANWLREKYAITCMANHPLGGLVDTVPLARKAGLGEIGRNGLLITKEFGPRCRISPIFVDTKLFPYTDNGDHEWIKALCKKCGSCMRACPQNAIYEEAKLVLRYDRQDIIDRYHNYDREKCYKSFSSNMGCGLCISVCPFSKNPKIYDKMKERYMDKEL